MAREMYRVFALTVYLLVAVANCLPAVNKLNNYKGFIPFEKMEAEDYTYANIAFIDYCSESSGAEFYINFLNSSSVVEYADVDFGAGVQMVTFRLLNGNDETPTAIYLHVGNATNPPIGTLQSTYTGTYCSDCQTFTGYLDIFPTGVQDLYFTFPSATGNVLAIDYFYFNRTLSLN